MPFRFDFEVVLGSYLDLERSYSPKTENNFVFGDSF